MSVSSSRFNNVTQRTGQLNPSVELLQRLQVNHACGRGTYSTRDTIQRVCVCEWEREIGLLLLSGWHYINKQTTRPRKIIVLMCMTRASKTYDVLSVAAFPHPSVSDLLPPRAWVILCHAVSEMPAFRPSDHSSQRDLSTHPTVASRAEHSGRSIRNFFN